MTGRFEISSQVNSNSEQGVRDGLIHHKFMQALHFKITLVIVVMKNAFLMELGTLADKIVPYLKPSIVQNTNVPQSINRYTRPIVSTSATSSATYSTRPFNENQRPLVYCGHLYYVERARTCKP